MFVLLWRKKVKTSKEKFFQAAAIFLYLFAIFLLLFIFSLEYFFEGLSFEQICFHVQYAKDIMSLKGEYVTVFSISVALFLVGAGVLYWLLKKLGTYVFLCGSMLLFVPIFLWGCLKYDFFAYIQNQFEYSDLYEKNYVEPIEENFSINSDSKNIVVFFLESMENKYNVLFDSFQILSSTQNSMGKYYQIYGSAWTIAGMVTALCGVPLDVDVSYNQYGSNYNFLPNLVCLPDILNSLEYKNYFVTSASSTFGGKDVFLKEHGVKQEHIYDVNYFRKHMTGRLYGGAWGYPDSFMYDFLKRHILALRDKKEHFFIVAETVNTHYPYNYLEKNCKKKYQDWRDVVLCTDKQISDFVQWFYKEGLDKDTILLIIGDHLSMDKEIAQAMSSFSGERTLVNILIADQKNIRPRKFSGVDIMPTIIEAADISSKSSKLGLGVSLFDENQQTLIEKYGLEELNKQLRKNSLVYESFL